jgi:hypothetical protein
MSMAIETATRRVATYERVSSEDQRERETIRTQTDELARSLARDARVELIERYVDDGVSGMIPLAERPAGGRLMRDAAAGRFRELHVYKFDRLGRDAVDLLVVRRRLMELGLRVISVVEAEPDLLSYDVQAVVADHARRARAATQAASCPSAIGRRGASRRRAWSPTRHPWRAIFQRPPSCVASTPRSPLRAAAAGASRRSSTRSRSRPTTRATGVVCGAGRRRAGGGQAGSATWS